MIQATDVFLNEKLKMSPSEEELELFHCFRGQLDEGFLLFQHGNLAITLQQNELRKLKVEMEMSYEEFNRQRDSCKKVLDDIKRDIGIEKNNLSNLKRDSNDYRRKIRHLEKKINKLESCQQAEETSKNLENFKIKTEAGYVLNIVKKRIHNVNYVLFYLCLIIVIKQTRRRTF